MPRISLHIEAESAAEFHDVLRGLALPLAPQAPYTGPMIAYVADEPAEQAAEPEAPKERKPRARKAETATAPAPEVAAPVESPTSAPSTAETASTPATPEPATAISAPAQPASPPVSAPEPVPQAASATYEEAKAALVKVLDAKSAAFAKEVLMGAVGHPSLSACPPDQYGKAMAALLASLA